VWECSGKDSVGKTKFLDKESRKGRYNEEAGSLLWESNTLPRSSAWWNAAKVQSIINMFERCKYALIGHLPAAISRPAFGLGLLDMNMRHEPAIPCD
jgi:hypothetical protein